jgi:asparagine synthase (glutamine-hydrolysing)
MTERLRHRGPDDGDLWMGQGASLGHRRLSIIDVSPAGRQPMSFKEFTIVYNGEIYNYRELRKELPGPFVSHSDTEVLLRLYAEHGERCVEKLRGMFAFAIWDNKRQSLFAARDRLGVKPFFYTTASGGFAFASEIKSLLTLASTRLDRSALLDYFTYKYIPAPKTIYSEIRKLLPGHTLTYDGSSVRTACYWSPALKAEKADFDIAAAKLDDLLSDAVVAHTVADVPVGLFLSGGLDSSALLTYVPKSQTFTIGFDVATHNEATFARRVAEHFQSDHHEEIVSRVDVEEALATLPAIYDEPFGDSSAWATFILARMARRWVKVALSGEGGDEVFSGYTRYQRWLALNYSPWRRVACSLAPPFSSVGRSLHRRGTEDLERYADLASVFNVPQKRALLAPDFIEPDYDHHWYFRQHWREDLDPVKRMQFLDLRTYLPDDLLVKVDRASMAVSLEVRPPLLDHKLVEFVLSLNSELLRKGLTGKRILRRVLEGRVPDEVLRRAKKGFSMPVRDWMSGRSGMLQSVFRRLASAGILRSARCVRLDGEQIWALLMLDGWINCGRVS